MNVADDDVRWAGISLAGVALLGTWAWAGHSSSQRWPEVGVPLDVLHHGAAAVWLGSLGIVGVVACRRLPPDQLARVAARLSRTAAVAVGLIVATGVAQTSCRVGNPARLFDATHGRYLMAKLALLAAMLTVANRNRSRVNTGFTRPENVNADAVAGLRRSVLVELGAGLAIIGITAGMVVSPPASAAADADRGGSASADYYNMSYISDSKGPR